MRILCKLNQSKSLLLIAAFSLLTATSAPTANAADDGRLEAIGGLSAAYMYTTYIAIGTTADGFGKDVYQAEQVKSIMTGFIGSMDAVKKQLSKVQANLTDPGDVRYIGEAVQIFSLLQDEARSLSKFAASKDNVDFQAYDRARTTVWPKIQKLLGIGGGTTNSSNTTPKKPDYNTPKPPPPRKPAPAQSGEYDPGR